jgi:hypothetical protein
MFGNSVTGGQKFCGTVSGEDAMKISGFTLNAGTGMAAGVILACLIALAVQLITGETTVWMWAIPVGVAAGLAIGVGTQFNRQDQNQEKGKTNT